MAKPKYDAGDIIGISCNTKSFGRFRFTPKQGEEYTFIQGGLFNTDDDSNANPDNSITVKKNKIPTSFSGNVIMSTGDFQNYTLLCESSDLNEWVVELIDGGVISIFGVPVGVPEFSTGTSEVSNFKIQSSKKASIF